MIARLPILALLLPAVLAGGAGAQEAGLAELKRTWTLEKKGDLFTAKIRDVLASAKVKSFSLHLDWWNGEVDERVGDEARANPEEYLFEVKHDRVWRAMPAVRRDLRLEAVASAPEGLFAGMEVRGEWSVRRKSGKEKVRSVRLSVVFLVPWGKGLAQPDLVVEAIRFEKLEKDPVPEGTFPLKRDFPKLRAGEKYPARVHVANRGYGDVREHGIELFLTGLDGKGRRRLPPIEVDVEILEGESLRARWTCPVPKKLKPGLYRLHAVADPGSRVGELDEANNGFSRIVRVVE